MTRVRRLGAVVLGLALAGSFSVGCSGDPEPIPPETSAAEPSESPTASPSESETPEPWQEKTDAGAEAFVRHWIAALNEARLTGNPDALHEFATLGTAACESCDNYVEYLHDIYDDGGTYKSKDWRILELVPTTRVNQPGDPQIAIQILQPAERIERVNGKDERYGGGKSTFTATLGWVDEQWAMRSWDIME